VFSTAQTYLAFMPRVMSSLMKYLSWFHQNTCFTPVTQYGESGILLSYEPNRVPGEFVLLKVNPMQLTHSRISIQGDIQEVHFLILKISFLSFLISFFFLFTRQKW